MTKPLDEKAIFRVVKSIRAPAERSAYLDFACGEDAEERLRIEALLDAHLADGGLLSNNAPVDQLGTDVTGRLGPGDCVGDYKILEQIGEGGFGIVYMADQLRPMQRRLAVKIIKPGMDSKQVIARFEAERQALALMDHPNIAKVFDAGATENGRPYFVMELVRGVAVTDYCNDNLLTTEERLLIFIDICSAVQHAHQKGLIHRDIKPSNILVAHDGERPVAKVIDFGIAKATQGRLTDKTLFTQFRQLMGTPTYMSPEQAQMTAVDVDTRSDVYSLGVLLYELLTGATPFDSQELLEAGFDEMCRKIREVDPVKPSTRLSSLSVDQKTAMAKLHRAEKIELERKIRGELDWIVMKAIEKSRSRRYVSADALKLDVQRFLSNEPVSAAAPSTSYKVWKFVRRNRKAFIAATFVTVLLTTATVISTWQALRATRLSRRATSAEQYAEENELKALRSRYAAEMMVAQSEAEGVNSKNVFDILKRQIPKPGKPDFRGFEWRLLWNNYRRELFALDGHTNEIRGIAMSPDGHWLASGSTDGTARIWDVAARREVWRCSEGKHCNQVAFSPDGRLLFTSWYRGADILWDLSNPASPRRLRDIESFGSFSPDGQTVISGGKTLKQWNLETGEALHEYSDPAFDGTEFAGQAHRGSRWSTSFSRDGRRILTVGRDWTVKLWDTESGELICRLIGDTSEVVEGAISPANDELVVTVSLSGAIRIWDGAGNELRMIQVGNPMDQVEFNLDGSKLIASERLGRIRVFETENWKEIASFDSRGTLGNLLISSTDDADVAVTALDSIRFWDISPSESVLDHSYPVRALEFSHDGETLAVGMANGIVQFWDVSEMSSIFTTEITNRIDPYRMSMPALTPFKAGFFVFSPDDQKAAIIGPEQTITIYNIRTKNAETILTAPNDPGQFRSVMFSPDGMELYTGMNAGRNSGVLKWNLDSPSRPTEFFEQPNYFGVPSLALSHDQQFVASGGADVMIRNVQQGTQHRTVELTGLPGMARVAISLSFSPDGKWFAAGTANSEIWLWDTQTWKHRTLPLISNVMSVEFNPECDRLVAADMWTTVKLWDVESGQSVAAFKGSVADLSPDGTILAVGCETYLSSQSMPESGRVRLYHAPPLQELD